MRSVYFRSLVLSLIFSVSGVAQEVGPDPSQKPFQPELLYPWMENRDSHQMRTWLKEQSSHTVNSLLRKRALWEETRHRIIEWMSENSGQPRKIDEIGPGEDLMMVDQGLGKPVRIQHYKDGQPIRTFFETPSYDPYSISPLSGDVGPLKKWLIIPVSKYGSIDELTLYVYDFTSGKLRWKLENSFENWVWINENQLGMTRYLADSVQNVIVDFSKENKGQPEVREDDSKIIPIANDPQDQNYLGWNFETGRMNLVRISTGEIRDLQRSFYEIAYSDQSATFLKGQFDESNQLFLLSHSGPNSIGDGRRIDTSMDWVQSIFPVPNGYLIYGYKGVTGALRLIDSQGEVVGSLDIPVGVSMSEVLPSSRENSVKLDLQSIVLKTYAVELDLAHMTLLDAKNLAERLHFDGKHQWVSRVIYGKSADGTEVPAVVTHRSGLKMDGKNPTLIEAYGGFGIPNVDNYHIGITKKIFLDHPGFPNGGVFVATALRGGGEFGPNWHTQALKLNKIKTFEDLIAITEKLHADGITSPKHTAILGGSNGGYTVAATANLRPDLFGVVVPINGVLDQVNKGYLDKAFQGWKYEYGDITESPEIEAFLRGISPVHNLGKNGPPPKYIIVNGQSDGRVNPIHSFTLIESLRTKFPESESVLVTIRHGGHSVNSIPFQDIHGFRVSSRLWTELLDGVAH